MVHTDNVVVADFADFPYLNVTDNRKSEVITIIKICNLIRIEMKVL